ncbi:MAG TPA: hypothetical protein VGN16_03055 [Acidobacteriaceae bacterium]
MPKPFSPNENGILRCLEDHSITGTAIKLAATPQEQSLRGMLGPMHGQKQKAELFATVEMTGGGGAKESDSNDSSKSLAGTTNKKSEGNCEKAAFPLDSRG